MGLDGTVDTGLIQVQRAHTNYILSTYCLNFSPANVAKVWVLKYTGGFFFGFFFGDYHHLVSCDKIIY